jgi:hypothetical protein
MTSVSLQTQLPTYVQGFTLPGLITYSVATGNVFQLDPCGDNDPFYPSSSGLCWYAGGVPALAGTFDGKSLDLSGGSGALPPLVIVAPGFDPQQQIADPGPPPTLDASQYPTQWNSYRIVANAIPEPGTLTLVFIGSLVLIRRAARYRIPPIC